MEDLQGLLEKINRDGLEKAEAEAKKIIAAAKAEAAALVKAAQDQAAATKAEAEKSSADYVRRAEETIAQAARDTVLEVKGALTSLFERLLTADVEKALGDPATTAAIAQEAVKSIIGGGEIACSEKFAAAIKAELASKNEFTVVTDETVGTGFTVKTDGGRVEHTFTAEAIAAELARRLRPDLRKLVS